MKRTNEVPFNRWAFSFIAKLRMIYHTESQSLSLFCSYLQCFDDAKTDDNGQYRSGIIEQ